MVLKLGLHFFRPVTTLCVYPAIVNQMFLGNAKKIPVACTTGITKNIFNIICCPYWFSFPFHTLRMQLP